MNRRHWYHCSSSFMGESFIARKTTPWLPSKSEPMVPRLCVCRSIAGCMAAKLFSRKSPLYVYRTESERSGVKPRGVWDSCITGEAWLIPPVKMVLVRTLPAAIVRECQDAARCFHEHTMRGSDVRLRVAQLAIAVKVLTGTPDGVAASDRSVSSWAADHYGIGDPEVYALNRAYEREAEIAAQADGGGR